MDDLIEQAANLDKHSTICQRCGRKISFVHIDRRSDADKSDVINTRDWGFTLPTVIDELKKLRVLVGIPANALCRNAGDEDFIRECIHCPECGMFPFGRDVCEIYDNGSVMNVVFNVFDYSHFDENGNWKSIAKYCACCGKEIEEGAEYFTVMDNYLQRNYFDTKEENIFCSERCVLDSLMVKSFINGEDKTLGAL